MTCQKIMSQSKQRKSKFSVPATMPTMPRMVPPAKRKTNKCLSLAAKQKVIDELDSRALTMSQICRKYGIPASTLSTFVKNRDAIKAALEETAAEPLRKRMRFGKYQELDAAVFQWLQVVQEVGDPVSGPIIKAKAEEIARGMGLYEFRPHGGWLNRFKQRKGIPRKSRAKKTGKSNSNYLLHSCIVGNLSEIAPLCLCV